MQYNVGDYVLIITDPNTNDKYYMEDGETYDFFSDGMIAFSGRTAQITSVSNKYRIDIDYGYWRWTDEMFMPVLANIEDQEIECSYEDFDEFLSMIL